ncbi:MAG: hypothetical protein JAY71_18760 [Candidatus Thiodiazotropha weberae]|nr:hypothetical protein [Candidatus Thiodiazotropha weberae]
MRRVKEPFRYQVDGVVHTGMDQANLDNLGLDEDRLKALQARYEVHIRSEEYFERQWKQGELQLTDRLMFTDATYRGHKLHLGSYIEEMRQYRQQLRDYNCLDQDRPVRPWWFDG